MYIEKASLVLRLEQLDKDHNGRPMPSMFGSNIVKKIEKGRYRVKVSEGTA